MMKAAIAIFLIGLGVVGIAYYTGVGSWDPTQIGRDAKAALSEGMSWSDVILAAGEPKSRRDIMEERTMVDGEELITYEPSTPIDFDLTLFENDLKAGNLKHGFIWTYFFSQQVAFAVSFNGEGKVESIEDVATAADLFQTRN